MFKIAAALTEYRLWANHVYPYDDIPVCQRCLTEHANGYKCKLPAHQEFAVAAYDAGLAIKGLTSNGGWPWIIGRALAGRKLLLARKQTMELRRAFDDFYRPATGAQAQSQTEAQR